MKPRPMILIGLLSVVSIIGFSACHPRKSFRAHFGDDAEKAAHRIDYMVGKLTRTLDLDGAQQERLRSMAGQLHAKMKEIRNDHDQVKGEMIDLISGETVDAGRINRFMDDRMERFKPVKELFAENLARFHAMLTPEQRTKLVAAIKDHEPGRCRFADKW